MDREGKKYKNTYSFTGDNTERRLRHTLTSLTAEWGSVDASDCKSVAGRAVREKVEQSNIIQHI